MTQLRTKRSHRPGYVLVVFAMLSLGLFALAALVIDLGFARAYPAANADRRRFRRAGRAALAERADTERPAPGVACRSELPERSRPAGRGTAQPSTN